MSIGFRFVGGVTSLGLLGLCSFASGCWIVAGTEDFSDAPPAGAGGAATGVGGAGGQGGAMPCVGPTCKEQGEPCEQADECTTGFCADGVCCDQSCSGSCVECAADDAVGTCVPLPLGPDPDRRCGGFGVCDGSGHCGEGEYVVGRMFGGLNPQLAFAVAPTEAGGFVLAGTTDTQLDSWSVDAVPPMSTGTTTYSNNDFFFARFSASGQAQVGGHAGSFLDEPMGLGIEDQIYDVVVDGAGNWYMAGWLNSAFDYGPGSVGTAAAADHDAVLFKMSSGAGFVWGHDLGSVGADDQGRAVAIEPGGNIVWAGTSAGGMFLDVVQPDGTPTGEPRVFGASTADVIHDVAIAADGRVAIAGQLGNAADIGGIVVMPDGPAGEPSPFVAVLSSATGDAVWVRQIEGPNVYGAVYGVAIGADGLVYASGDVGGTEANFGGGFEALLGSPASDPVPFVVAYDASGNYRFHQVFGRGASNTIRKVVLDAWGNVFGVGQISVEQTIGAVTLEPVDQDAVAFKLTPDGEMIWGRVLGASAQQFFHNAAFDGERFYAVGASLGPFPVPGGGDTPPVGSWDMTFAVFTP